MKKTGLITAFIAAILLFSSCGEDIKTTQPTTAQSDSGTQEQPSETAPVSLSDILARIKDDVALPDMMDYSENDIKIQLGVTAEDYSEIMCSASNDGYYPDFIFIAKAKDSSTLDKMESKLGNYRSHKINEWKDYLPEIPERYEAIERSKVVINGDYVFLVISTQDEKIKGIVFEELN